MSAKTGTQTQLDRSAVEERTQAIGRELFEAARRHHAHLSVLNRWTAQILSWCLSDPMVKSRVLRFIDVLPSLTTAAQIAEHLRDYFPTSELRLPAALRIGSQLARPGLLTQRALAAVIRQSTEQIARQFIAESHPEAAQQLVQQLAGRGASCTLDILGEQVLSESESDQYVAHCTRLLDSSAKTSAALPAARALVTCGPRANLSVKPSALTPRFDPISPLDSIERACRRLEPLLQLASQHQALIHLDMEQYELRDLTLALAQHLLIHPPAANASLGVVIQAYLRDSQLVVEELLSWLAAHERTLTVRLVKGAYWDSEVAIAHQRQWPVPVWEQKSQTDAAFERLTDRLLQAHPLVITAIGSHNVRSIAHAMAAAETFGLARDQLEFQLLYGMGDALHAAIVERGYPVRIYTPIGSLIPGMAYLVRRILENTANESFLRQEFAGEHNIEELLRPPVADAAHPARPQTAESGWHGEPFMDVARSAERDTMARVLADVQRQFGAIYPALIGESRICSTAQLTVRNPAHPSQIIGMVAAAGPADVEAAVRAAQQSQPGWAGLSAPHRVACLQQAAELIRQRRHVLAAWMVFEVGKTWREADADLVEAIEYLEYYGRQMVELAAGKPLIQLPGERNQYRYLPRGVAVVIAPWNFPAAILAGMTAAALATGHAVIVKPAEQSSVIAAHLVQILREASVPAGVVQYLPGIGEQVGAALVRHPGTHTVLFTGSKTVGLSLIETCARVVPGQRFVKHVITEMGGKNAIIVDADADLDAAVQGTMLSAFGYAGQKCSAASRVIVHQAVYDRFVARLIAATDRLVVGDPADPRTDVGPLIEPSAVQRLHEAIDHAKRVGRVVYRYPDDRLPGEGYFVGPTIVEVPADDRLAREELFGPFLAAFKAHDFDEALRLANDTEYALTGGVYSRSMANLDRAARAFDVGNLYLNRPITGALVGRQPFGGHRLSGLGTKAGGPDYLLQLLIPKTICTNTARHGMPLE